MPVFDFRCLQCDHIFEFSRAFGNKTKPACPECKSKKTEKLMSPPMVVFKGEGFYKTDSSKKQASKKPEIIETPVKDENPKSEVKKDNPPTGGKSGSKLES